jgi:thiol:disulfide interchange protein
MRFFLLLLLLSVLTSAGCGSSKQPVSAAPEKPITPGLQPAASSPKNNQSTSAEPIATETNNRHINWVSSDRLMPVLEEAQKENKPVFVDFDASWCGPCKVMDEEVFSHPLVYTYLNVHYLCIRVDYDSPSGQTISGIYQVNSLPTVLFLNPQGVELARETGFSTPSKIRTLAETSVSKM